MKCLIFIQRMAFVIMRVAYRHIKGQPLDQLRVIYITYSPSFRQTLIHAHAVHPSLLYAFSKVEAKGG